MAEYLRVTRPVVGHCHRLTGPPALAVVVVFVAGFAAGAEEALATGAGFALLVVDPEDAGGVAG
ncbi:MAG: hypothetical protein ABJ013_01670 [Halioglobus sp.]